MFWSGGCLVFDKDFGRYHVAFTLGDRHKADQD